MFSHYKLNSSSLRSDLGEAKQMVVITALKNRSCGSRPISSSIKLLIIIMGRKQWCHLWTQKMSISKKLYYLFVDLLVGFGYVRELPSCHLWTNYKVTDPYFILFYFMVYVINYSIILYGFIIVVHKLKI